MTPPDPPFRHGDVLRFCERATEKELEQFFAALVDRIVPGGKLGSLVRKYSLETPGSQYLEGRGEKHAHAAANAATWVLIYYSRRGKDAPRLWSILYAAFSTLENHTGFVTMLSMWNHGCHAASDDIVKEILSGESGAESAKETVQRYGQVLLSCGRQSLFSGLSLLPKQKAADILCLLTKSLLTEEGRDALLMASCGDATTRGAVEEFVSSALAFAASDPRCVYEGLLGVSGEYRRLFREKVLSSGQNLRQLFSPSEYVKLLVASECDSALLDECLDLYYATYPGPPR